MRDLSEQVSQTGRRKPVFADRRFFIGLFLGVFTGMTIMVIIGIGLYSAGIATFGATPSLPGGPALTCPATPDLLLVCPTAAPPPTATATATETPTATPDLAATATAACATFEALFRPTPCP